MQPAHRSSIRASWSGARPVVGLTDGLDIAPVEWPKIELMLPRKTPAAWTLWTAVAITLVGCGGSPSAVRGSTTPRATEPTDPTIRVYAGDTLALEIRPDGRVLLGGRGKEVFTIGPDDSIGGAIRLTAGGAIISTGKPHAHRVEPDGRAHGHRLPSLRITENGTLAGQPEDDVPVRVVGASTLRLRRRTLFVIVLLAGPPPEFPDSEIRNGIGRVLQAASNIPRAP